jgi:hypothetical protein
MRRIWAVASNTIAQAIRLKVASIVIVLLVVLLPMLGLTVVGDQTLKGKLQTFSSYGLSLTSILLCLLTIVISCYSLTSDLKYKQIFLVATKPIRRFELVLGKFLGVVVLDMLLLAIFSGIILGLTWALPWIAKGTPEVQRQQADLEFFTARAVLTPGVDEQAIEQEVQRRYEQLVKDDQIPENMTRGQVFSQLRNQEIFRSKTCEPGREKIWEFDSVRTRDPNDLLFVRYKYRIAGQGIDSQIAGAWQIGDIRPLKTGQYPGTPIFVVERTEATQTELEFAVPAACVAADGFVGVVFFNNPQINTQTIILDNLKVMYRTGSFEGNFFRVAGMILVRLVFLAALGVSVSTWLSFPVAVLICLAAYTSGMINGFIMESFLNLSATMNMFYNFTIRPILWFLPKFDEQFNPTAYLVEAKSLGWMFLAQAWGVTALIKSGLLLLIGMEVFRHREISKTTNG